MATTRKTPAKKPDEPEKAEGQAPGEEPARAEASSSFADEVHKRGGWDVGYVGDRVDDADDDSYTVTGVLRAAKADAESGDE